MSAPQRPRVLLVGRTRYRLPLRAGLARKFDALERVLDYRVLAAAEAGARSGGRFALAPPFPVRSLDGAAFWALLPLRVAREARRFRPDVVLCESPHVGGAALAALAGLSLLHRRPRLVVEVHGEWRHSTRLYGSPARRALSPVADAVASLALRRADAVRALSPFTARLVEEVRGAPPEASFPAYTDLAVFAGRPPSPLSERPTALFVGVLEPYKNVEGLAAAWRQVARALPEARLVVVGRGPQGPVVERLVADLPGRVEHVWGLSPEEVAERMDASTLLVLPSRFEGLGLVVIESFARGRGVVATRAGGILDLVDDGVEGLLVELDDTAGLAAALERVLADSALAARLGQAAGERFRGLDASPDDFAERVRALVEGALDRGLHRPSRR